MMRRSDLALSAAGMAGLLLVLVACGTAGVRPAAQKRPDRVAVTSTPTPGYTGPHFDSPEAAMRYLAAAWNRHDIVSMKHVTTPEGRAALTDMYGEAVNLRLDYCQARAGMGDYDCHFIHDYPVRLHKKGEGHAEFIAGPARNPGWYMTVFVGCG
ncbi:MAG: hypothetical protein JO079_08495 [Frankiaceae bacterium]|nr:hypothetical protein [Frankiaceae bacterium]